MEDSEVAFSALINSWNPPYRFVNIKNAKAELNLLSYGSFTIDTMAIKGKTELELDLADLNGVTEEF